jgi:hypothetical protein
MGSTMIIDRDQLSIQQIHRAGVLCIIVNLKTEPPIRSSRSHGQPLRLEPQLNWPAPYLLAIHPPSYLTACGSARQPSPFILTPSPTHSSLKPRSLDLRIRKFNLQGSILTTGSGVGTHATVSVRSGSNGAESTASRQAIGPDQTRITYGQVTRPLLVVSAASFPPSALMGQVVELHVRVRGDVSEMIRMI